MTPCVFSAVGAARILEDKNSDLIVIYLESYGMECHGSICRTHKRKERPKTEMQGLHSLLC